MASDVSAVSCASAAVPAADTQVQPATAVDLHQGFGAEGARTGRAVDYLRPATSIGVHCSRIVGVDHQQVSCGKFAPQRIGLLLDQHVPRACGRGSCRFCRSVEVRALSQHRGVVDVLTCRSLLSLAN